MLCAKIGKILLLLCFAASSVAQRIVLRVVSEQGRALKQIAAHAPCMVEVVIPGSVTLRKRPRIEGIEPSQIIREQESMQMYVRNGSTEQERIIGYLVSFSDLGTQHIGPAYLETDAGQLVSNEVTIEVQESAQAAVGNREAFVKFTLAKERAYVQEAVPYTIEFYYPEDAVQQISLQSISLPDATLVPAEQVRQESVTQGGEPYRKVTWSGVIYPHKAGRLKIPRIVVDYQEAQTSHSVRNQWLSFMHMMGGFFTQKQAFSESPQVMVQPLPTTQHNVQGVGTISHLELVCSDTETSEGESVTCTLSVTGNFNPHALQVPLLQVPDTFRVYESQTKTEGAYPRVTKTYEYIVQPLHAGDYELPSQRYVFFDPQREAYTTMVTPPHKLRVKRAAQGAGVPVEEHPTHVTPAATDVAEQELPINPATQQAVELPWWLFLFLCIVPLFIKLFHHPVRRGTMFVRKKRMYQKATRKVRAALQHAVAQQNAYEFWMAWQAYNNLVHPEQFLQGEAYAAWSSFSDRAQEAAFSAQKKQSLHHLLSQAEAVLLLIEQAAHVRGGV